MFLRLLKVINWFLTRPRSAPIVDEPASEKTTMETQIEPLNQVRDWAIDRIESMTNQGDALALVAEFDEWIDVEENQEINYLCIEEDGWGEQEIDIR